MQIRKTAPFDDKVTDIYPFVDPGVEPDHLEMRITVYPPSRLNGREAFIRIGNLRLSIAEAQKFLEAWQEAIRVAQDTGETPRGENHE
jgi:hypothetical protein